MTEERNCTSPKNDQKSRTHLFCLKVLEITRSRENDCDEEWFQQNRATPTHQITSLTGWESDFR